MAKIISEMFIIKKNGKSYNRKFQNFKEQAKDANLKGMAKSVTENFQNLKTGNRYFCKFQNL